MRLFALLKQRKLRPTWKYKSHGIIWRVVPTEFEQLVGEQRDIEKKEVSFFCVGQRTGEVAWENKTYGEQWWMGIEAVHKDILLLHRFATPDMPQHKGITAVDLSTGKQLWSHGDLKFATVQNATVVASKDSFEGSKLVEVHYRTGEPVHSVNEVDAMAGMPGKTGAMNPENEMRFPIPEETPSDSVQQHCETREKVGPVEVLETNELVIFNYHRHAPGRDRDHMRVDNILRVLEKESGSVIYADTLNTGAPGIVPDSFFVLRDTLYYVKDRNTLTAVRLTSRLPME